MNPVIIEDNGHPHSIMINVVLPLYIHGYKQQQQQQACLYWIHCGILMGTQKERTMVVYVLLVLSYPLTVCLFRYNHAVSTSMIYISFSFLFVCTVLCGCVGVFSYCCYPISLLTCNFLVPRFIARSKHTTHSLSLTQLLTFWPATQSPHSLPFFSFMTLPWAFPLRSR